MSFEDPNGPVSPELKEILVRKIHRQSGDGQELFVALGLTRQEMKQVYRQARNVSLNELLHRMFYKWQEKEGLCATRRHLKDACYRLGRRDLMWHICDIQ